MSYEPGSPECRSLIEAKENILNAMKALGSFNETNNARNQLLEIYNELEGMHELRRMKENSNL